jgi:hypothetical protein
VVYSVVVYSVVVHSEVVYSVVLYSVVLYSVAVYSVVLYSVVVYSEVVYSVVVYSVVFYSVVVYSVVTIITNVIISGGKRRSFSYLLLEYDFCVINWITVDFTPQIQINTQREKTIYDSMNSILIPKEVLPQDLAYQVQWDIVYKQFMA